jgi:hypothetical protein
VIPEGGDVDRRLIGAVAVEAFTEDCGLDPEPFALGLVSTCDMTLALSLVRVFGVLERCLQVCKENNSPQLPHDFAHLKCTLALFVAAAATADH